MLQFRYFVSIDASFMPLNIPPVRIPSFTQHMPADGLRCAANRSTLNTYECHLSRESFASVLLSNGN